MASWAVAKVEFQRWLHVEVERHLVEMEVLQCNRLRLHIHLRQNHMGGAAWRLRGCVVMYSLPKGLDGLGGDGIQV